MKSYRSLKREAARATHSRGHRMSWSIHHGEHRSLVIGVCVYCEMQVSCDPKPEPNGIDIGGEAVALNCTERLAGHVVQPQHMDEYVGIAKKLGLSYVAGRAFYACSRILNEGVYSESDRVAKATHRMVHAREYTAAYWQGHFENGGSVRNVTMTHEEYNARRRERNRR
jgi:hypothetical protein